jgi:hypothetical protein
MSKQKQKTGGCKKRSQKDKPARVRYHSENRVAENKAKKQERHQRRLAKQKSN